jgi:radical SAM protein with 4Fe4S-binding SPASM domain
MICPHPTIPEDSAFFDRLVAVQHRLRLPISGSIEVTQRCNLRCAHCYLGDYRRGHSGLKELTTAEIYRLLDQMANAGCLWLLITGGEPFLRPDLLDIYRYARRKGLLLTLFTNATLIDEATADALAEMPPQSIEITIYGATPQIYQSVTGRRASYQRFRRGLDLLLQRGLNVKLKTMLMTLNRHELPAMQALAKSLGVEFRYDPMLNAAIDGGRAPIALRLLPEEVVSCDQADPTRQYDLRRLLEGFKGQQADDHLLYTCGAGQNTFHIDPFGRLSACIMSRSQTYDLRQGTFQQGWDQFLASVRQQPTAHINICARCELLPMCGQCPGWACLESGDPEKKVDYLCKVAHLRYITLGLNLPSV